MFVAKGGKEETQVGKGHVIASPRQTWSSHWPGTHTRPVPSLFNCRIENLTRVGPWLSLVFTYLLSNVGWAKPLIAKH